MNEQNVEYLKDNLKYMGFNDKLNEQLEKNINAQTQEFKLNYQGEFNKQKMDATLHFRKSDQSEMYFFNRYDATLEKANKEKLSQTFYLNKGSGATLKEAYNLLNGRAVNKDLTNQDGQKYNAWIQLDFENKNKQGNFETKQFHENYGYNLEKSLSNFPIKELENNEQKDALLKSLQKGNVQSVIIEQNGTEQRMFIEANPQFKTVNIYDKDMKLQQHEPLKKNQTIESTNVLQQKLEQKQDAKKDISQEIKPMAAVKIEKSKQVKSRSKSKSISR